jgi:Tfp pilus assembly protein PilN
LYAVFVGRMEQSFAPSTGRSGLKVAGFSIEGATLRVSVAGQRMGRIRHLADDEVQLPEDEAQRGDRLKDALLQWKERYGVHDVVLGLSLSQFSHHVVDLPVTSRQDIHGALAFELERYLPLPPEEYAFDFLTTGITSEGSRNLVMATRRDRMGWITAALQATDMKLRAVRCSVLEMLNELAAAGEAVHDVIVLVPETGGYALMGLKDARPAEIMYASDPREALAFIRRIVDRYPGGIIAALDDVPDWLAPFDVTKLTISPTNPLALSAFKKRHVALNFTPAELVRARRDYYPTALAALCGLAVLLFFSTAWLSYYKDLRALRTLERKVEQIKATSSELMDARREFEGIDERRRFLLHFQQRRNRHIAILQRMSGLLPEDAWLTHYVSSDKGRIELQGFAKRSAEIIAPLENSDMFRNVEFSSPVTVRNNQERFAIRMELER